MGDFFYFYNMRYFTLIFFLFYSANLYAVEKCGILPTSEEVQKIFEYRQQFIKDFPDAKFAGANNELITIPVKVFLIADDNGKNRYDIQILLAQFCELNELYQQIGFYFYLLPDVEFINDSRFIKTDGTTFYNDLDRYFGNVMYNYYQYGAMNVYYTLGTGICGMGPFPSWASRYEGRTGLLMEGSTGSKGCAGVGSNTLAHEIGHHFDLLHPFQGWDSKDSRYSEYVTRAVGLRNCETAGDGFCDTFADVLDFSCPYTGTFKDLRGDFYNPDVSLVMSYHADRCQTKFSDEQIAHMRQVIVSDTGRIVYTHDQISDFSKVSTTNIISPVNLAEVPFNLNTLFEWEAVPNADAYFVSFTTGSGGVIHQAIVKNANSYNTQFSIGDIGRTLNWKVTPVRFNQPCSTPSVVGRFKVVSASTGINNKEAFQFAVYPNPLIGERNVTIQLQRDLNTKQHITLKLISLNGQVVQETIVPSISSQFNFKLEDQISSGVYFISFQTENGNYQSKLIIQ
jgi:hypothetical protein